MAMGDYGMGSSYGQYYKAGKNLYGVLTGKESVGDIARKYSPVYAFLSKGGLSDPKEGFKAMGRSVLGITGLGSSFGSKGSKTNKMAQQYQAMVNDFDTKYLQPTMAGMNNLKRNVNRSTRVGSQSFRSVMADLTGAKKSLDDLVGASDFGRISGRIKEITDLVDGVGKVFGKGGGPNIGDAGEAGVLKLPKPNLNTQAPIDKVPSRSVAFGNSLAPVKSEGHRFAVKTKRTPGSSVGKNLASVLKSNIGSGGMT